MTYIFTPAQLRSGIATWNNRVVSQFSYDKPLDILRMTLFGENLAVCFNDDTYQAASDKAAKYVGSYVTFDTEPNNIGVFVGTAHHYGEELKVVLHIDSIRDIHSRYSDCGLRTRVRTVKMFKQVEKDSDHE
jgi:hypothetical protein